jgi:prepilin-type N-terminal cleavage/methylation domain-containing protein
MKRRGFTLIEIIVYIALFAILFGGAVGSVFNLVESYSRNQTKTMIQEEGNFLIAKVNWAVSGSTINEPLTSTGSLLSVSKTTGFEADGSQIIKPITIDLLDTNVILRYPDPAKSLEETMTFRLNNSNVKIENLSFTHSTVSGSGINPESIKVSFTITALTPTGGSVSQDFSATSYVRK